MSIDPIKAKHPVDVHVGQRIRQKRWMLGMTQQQLASVVDVKFQQIQKYETGANRVSASRLWDIANVMNVPVSFFFEGLGRSDSDGATSQQPVDVALDKEALDLLRLYYGVPTGQRQRLFDLTRALSDVG